MTKPRRAHHEGRVDDCKPSMGALDIRNEGVGVRVVVRLTDGGKEEGHDKKAERWHPRSEGMC